MATDADTKILREMADHYRGCSAAAGERAAMHKRALEAKATQASKFDGHRTQLKNAEAAEARFLEQARAAEAGAAALEAGR